MARTTKRGRPITVQGGAYGVVADCDEIDGLAAVFKAGAVAVSELTLRLQGALIDPTLLASTVLDPVGAARFEGSLTVALDGVGGLGELAAQCAFLSLGLAGAAASYRLVDHLDTEFTPALDDVITAPHTASDVLNDLAQGQWGAAGQRLVTSDVALLELGINFKPSPYAVSLQTLVLGLRDLFPGGRAQVTARGPDLANEMAPRDLSDIMAGLAGFADRRRDGEIDVEVLGPGPLTPTDAPRPVIVDIPGVGDWVPNPASHDVAGIGIGIGIGIGTTLHALAGESNAYEQGVLAAMKAAGVRPTDDVLLVGHSLGGVIATDLARDASGEFHISHVITAGSPIGLSVGAVPSRVQVLALENDGDVVPGLDGAPNPDRPNVTTVRLAHDHGDVLANHDLDQSYRPGAEDVDASGNASVRSYLGGLRPFLDAETAQTSRYLITRK